MRHVREHGAKLPPGCASRLPLSRARRSWAAASGYVYPHDEPGGVSDESLLPAEVRGARFYEPTDRGFEERMRERLEELRNLRGDA